MPEPQQAGAQTMSALEDAIYLLRAAPLSTLLCHWTGSAPFALALILFWNDITQYRPSNAACVADSLALAVLLAWMNGWRAAFAGKLRSQLAGAPAAGLNAWRMAGYQSLLSAGKLIVLPIAALIVFPLASTVAFYRYAAVLCCRPDLSFKQVVVRSWKLAASDGRQTGRQTWAMLSAVALLQLLVTLNVATALAILPQLVRMLTGYESIFARAGVSFLINPLFFMASIAIGWLAIDPFIQAVYCVMYFRRESLENGEDLRAALRVLRQRALAAAALLCIFAGGSKRALAAAAVSPEPLRKSIERTMQGHEYDWRLPPEASAQTKPPWLLNMVEKLFHGIAWLMDQIGSAIGALFRWIFERVSMQGGEPGTAPAHALSLGIYVLIAVILILAALLIVRILRARRARPHAAAVTVPVPLRLEDESITPDRLPEDRWIEMAENCLREQNYRLAVRAFYLANLAWLGRHEWIAINPGKTNREYETDLRRRARPWTARFGPAATPLADARGSDRSHDREGVVAGGATSSAEARGLFTENLAAFERTWYGLHPATPEAVELFRARNGRMKILLAQPETVAA